MATRRTTKRTTKRAATPSAADSKDIAPKAQKPAKEAKRSHLESAWIREWNRQGGPAVEEEYQFHPVRKWRADFAHVPTRTLIEIEGGAYGGRHTRGKGFKEDLDKYLTAHLHGWRVIRIGAHQVRGDVIRAVIGEILERKHSAESPDNSAESPAGIGECAAGDQVPGRAAGAVCLSAVDSGGEDSRPEWLKGGMVSGASGEARKVHPAAGHVSCGVGAAGSGYVYDKMAGGVIPLPGGSVAGF